MNSEVFLDFLTQCFLPILKTDQVLSLENASPHRCAAVSRLRETTGVKVIFWPPDSPHLNPIELCWSKVKTAIKAATAWAKETLYQALLEAFGQITPTDAEGWFRHGL